MKRASGRVPSGCGLLVGTHTFAASGDGLRRQAASIASLQALARVRLVNVQFARDPHHADGIDTLAVLRNTSNTLTGRAGPRKPDVSEIFAALFTEAVSRDIPLFCFTNADIIFTQRAVDWILSGSNDTCMLSRQNFDGVTGADQAMELTGTDVFAMTTPWWTANAHRFRRYLLGEVGFDNVYTAIMMCHGNGALENRRPLVRHETHAARTVPSPHFGEYIRLLCALDALYFTRWCFYWDGLVRLRARGASEAEETAWARTAFTWRPTLGDRAVQQARSVKAHLRYVVNGFRRANRNVR